MVDFPLVCILLCILSLKKKIGMHMLHISCGFCIYVLWVHIHICICVQNKLLVNTVGATPAVKPLLKHQTPHEGRTSCSMITLYGIYEIHFFFTRQFFLIIESIVTIYSIKQYLPYILTYLPFQATLCLQTTMENSWLFFFFLLFRETFFTFSISHSPNSTQYPGNKELLGSLNVSQPDGSAVKVFAI